MQMTGTRTVLSSAPWVNRGGSSNSGSNAGVFNFNNSWAGGATSSSFRSVLSAG